MRLRDLVTWPPRCDGCATTIDDWTDSGFAANQWFHKRCWQDGATPPHANKTLASPLEGVGTGLPMILFLLLFHVGGGAAVFGWFSLTQAERGGVDTLVSTASLVGGLLIFLAGMGGFVLEIVLRARTEAVRQAIERAGGWQQEAR